VNTALIANWWKSIELFNFNFKRQFIQASKSMDFMNMKIETTDYEKYFITVVSLFIFTNVCHRLSPEHESFAVIIVGTER